MDLVLPLSNHGHGQVFVDSTIPKYAYGTLLDENAIFKVDAQTKEVVKRLKLDAGRGSWWCDALECRVVHEVGGGAL